MSFEGKRSKQKGAFEIMIPHGAENTELYFMTSEHGALLTQVGDRKPLPKNLYELGTIEQDLDSIKIVRYKAPVLKVRIVDKSGKEIKKGFLPIGLYDGLEPPSRQYVIPSHVMFQRQKDGWQRSRCLVPGIDLNLSAKLKGFKSETKKVKLKEGEVRQVSIVVVPSDDAGNADGKAQEGSLSFGRDKE